MKYSFLVAILLLVLVAVNGCSSRSAGLPSRSPCACGDFVDINEG